MTDTTTLEQQVLTYLRKNKVKRADRVNLARLKEKLSHVGPLADIHRAMDALYNQGHIGPQGHVLPPKDEEPNRDHAAEQRTQLRERLHYTTSRMPSSRLCGAPASEWSTVDTSAVTCPDCKAQLAALTPDSVRCRYTDCAEHHPAAREDEQVTCPTCRATLALDSTPAPAEPTHGTLPTTPNRSWAPEVIADGSGRWCGNALRFATQEEAEANVRDLSWRWALVRETRVVESVDEVNYMWSVEQGLVPCKKEG